MDRSKPERIRYGKNLAPLLKYPKAPTDHPIYDLFGSLQEEAEIIQASALPSLTEIRQKIRETGRRLAFPALHLRILGVTDGLIVSQPLS